MTHQLPPPPPDRAHLQHQPPPGMGPGGAYGPSGQPVPWQPPGLAASKPGTVTGIQVILWIFLGLSVIGNLLSIVSMVAHFDPFTLIALAFAVYSGVQSLASGVHLARGRRWAWIWTLVSAIVGLAFAAVAIVLGIVFVEVAWTALLVGVVLAGLYGTLLGLLCSKSARQWMLMHRIQRGEVPVPGMGMGAVGAPVPGAGMGAVGAPAPGAIGGLGAAPAAPERPAVRPVAVKVAVATQALLIALVAWAAFDAARGLYLVSHASREPSVAVLTAAMLGSGHALLTAVTGVLLVACALITVIGVHRGSFGARAFTIVWTSFMLLAWAFNAIPFLMAYFLDGGYYPPDQRAVWTAAVVRECAILALIVAAFVTVLLPGVRAWTPGKPIAPLVVMVPVARQPRYGTPQQGYQPQGYPPQQPADQPYPPG